MNIQKTITKVKEYVVDKYYTVLNHLGYRNRIWYERKQRLKQKQDYMQQVLQSQAFFTPEEPDKKLALRCADYLKAKFPSGITERILNMPLEQRHDFFLEIEKDVENIMNVHVENVGFKEMDSISTAGGYSHENSALLLNVRWLTIDCLTDDKELIDKITEELVFTIFHELKHTRQHLAIQRRADYVDYGYSEKLLQKWQVNNDNYIQPAECDEAYIKQPLEVDAFGFEKNIRETYNKLRAA